MRTLVVAGVLVVLAGCSQVESVHPLSDSRSSIEDDRLVGEWVAVNPEALKAEQEGHKVEQPAEEPDKLVIRRSKGDGIWYELVNSTKDEERYTLFITKLGDRRFASVHRTGPEHPGSGYMLLQYEVPADGEIRFYVLHPGQTADAIQRGQLEGTIERADAKPEDDPNEPREVRRIRLTASTEKLRTHFSTKDGQALFHTAAPALILKRARK